MDLDTSLVKQFVESTNDSNTVTTRKYFYGTFKLTSTSAYVQLDGSDAMTPVSLGSEAKNNDRVVVTIENHKASILSNLTTPASGYSASDLYNEVADPATGDLTVTGTLKVAKEYVDSLVAENILAENIVASNAYIKYLTTDNVTAESLTATDAYIKALKTDTIVAGEITANAVTAEELKAMKATVDSLDVTSLDATYARIDWANITKANIENLLVKGDIITNDITSVTGEFTNYLTGVNILGDIITAGTIIADRLILKDETPNYYCASSDVYYVVEYDDTTGEFTKTSEVYSDTDPKGAFVMVSDSDVAITTTGENVFNVYKSILYRLNNERIEQSNLSYDSLKRLTLNGRIITAETITATKIAANAITADKILAGSITADKIAANTLTLGQFSESLQNNISEGVSAKASTIVLEQFNKNLNNYLTFNSSTGLVLGETGSPFKTVISNTMLKFMQGTDAVAWIEKSSFYFGQGEVISSLKIGDFLLNAEDAIEGSTGRAFSIM